MGVTKDDVVQAYRLFLGREPENSEVIESFLSVGSIDQLRRIFLECDEFQTIAAPYRDNFNKRLLANSSMDVNLNASPKELEKIISHIESTWERLGEEEPYWSVLSSEQFTINKFSQHSDDFYQSADSDIRMLESALTRCKRQVLSSGSCFEFGCGVGRVTAKLASMFEKVVAYDISKSHLDLTSAYLGNEGIANVVLEHYKRGLKISDLGKFDFIFSIIVLQHNPPPVMHDLLEQFCKILKPKGLAYFQLPVFRCDYSFDVRQYFNNEYRHSEIEMHALPQQYVFSTLAKNKCIALEVREDNLVGLPNFISNTFLIEKLP